MSSDKTHVTLLSEPGSAIPRAHKLNPVHVTPVVAASVSTPDTTGLDGIGHDGPMDGPADFQSPSVQNFVQRRTGDRMAPTDKGVGCDSRTLGPTPPACLPSVGGLRKFPPCDPVQRVRARGRADRARWSPGNGTYTQQGSKREVILNRYSRSAVRSCISAVAVAASPCAAWVCVKAGRLRTLRP